MTGRPAGGTLLAMRKSNKEAVVEAPVVEAVEAPVEKIAEAVAPEPVVEAAPEPKPEPKKVRNLSVEARIKHLEYQCMYAKSKVSPHATQPAGILKRDKDGNVIIRDGVPVLDDRRITKHAAIDLEYGEQIEKIRRTGKL